MHAWPSLNGSNIPHRNYVPISMNVVVFAWAKIRNVLRPHKHLHDNLASACHNLVHQKISPADAKKQDKGPKK